LVALSAFEEADENTTGVGGDANGEAILRPDDPDIAPTDAKNLTGTEPAKPSQAKPSQGFRTVNLQEIKLEDPVCAGGLNLADAVRNIPIDMATKEWERGSGISTEAAFHACQGHLGDNMRVGTMGAIGVTIEDAFGVPVLECQVGMKGGSPDVSVVGGGAEAASAIISHKLAASVAGWVESILFNTPTEENSRPMGRLRRGAKQPLGVHTKTSTKEEHHAELPLHFVAGLFGLVASHVNHSHAFKGQEAHVLLGAPKFALQGSTDGAAFANKRQLQDKVGID
jgi:hypothetical protein